MVATPVNDPELEIVLTFNADMCRLVVMVGVLVCSLKYGFDYYVCG